MRKYLLPVMTLLAVSCANEDVSLQSESGAVYTATMEQSDTKVYVDDNLSTRWTANDTISIFSTTYNARYRFMGATGDAEGTFIDVESSYYTGQDVPTTYAVYPYRQTTTVSASGKLTMYMPAVQHYAENSYGLGANTMVAVTQTLSSKSLKFRNLCGFLVFKFYGAVKVKSITLTGHNHEKIAGEGTVAPIYGENPDLVMSDVGTETITLDCGEGVTLGTTAEAATSFWITIPPVTFSKGFTVTVTDTDGRSMVKKVSSSRTVIRNVRNEMAPIEAVCVNHVKFDDENFKAYCVEHFDTDGDGEISYDEAVMISDLNIREKSISSLNGIEHFPLLHSLDCGGNQLTTLDVSSCAELEWLSCDNNQLTSLNLSNLTSLYYLACVDNPLTSLDVSNCTALEQLLCPNNQLSSIDASNCTVLKKLYCYRNRLTSLDVSGCTALGYLDCSRNQLAILDVSDCTALYYLNCENNQLAVLDVSSCTELKYLCCRDNLLTVLDVSNNVLLTDLLCWGNPSLTEIWLKRGQTITNLNRDPSISTIKYKD